MRIPISVTPGATWRSRTPTLRGHIDPPTWGRNLDRGSTVQRRIEQADFERTNRDRNPVLTPGMLVIWERSPWRVVEIREIPQDLWPAPWPERWDTHFRFWFDGSQSQPAPDPATWRDRPINLVLEPDGGGKRKHLASRASFVWDVLPEHYAVCRSCGELPPCREEELDKTVNRQIAKSDRLLSIPAGACMGCGEAISGRQKSVSFPGPNLWRLDLPAGTARFHVRKECSHWVYEYGEQWRGQGAPVDEAQPALFDGEG
ncbi:hypothetical protein [Kitasatospora sp. NPDC047058]|uniref:hypothetical protein n=1 Tax=Kitasatospora sp. NPDC047058 TaxID=3155620 RepID=UPI00341137E6